MAELSVSKKNIYQYLTDSFQESVKKLFIIPEYQRAYSWDVEKCDVLWNDIKDFHKSSNNTQGEYFLGTIVTCLDKQEGINIIDGQQRITSFFLLLRAFYKKLDAMLMDQPKDDEIQGLMNQVGSCIWDVNPMSKKVTDKTTIHIHSLVATEKDNELFHSIIINGDAAETKSNYVLNYNYFYQQCDEYARTSPLDWKQLCLCILNQCIVLPIECKDLDAALTIFSTLNDRGMPLCDSDIFKAQLYRIQNGEEQKNCFTQKWKDVTEVLNDAGLTFDDIFRYYTHYIRAAKNDKSKEIGLRKFYSDNNYSRLKVPLIMENISSLASFWKQLLKNDDDVCTEETKKLIQCLQCYPNEYWKYPTTVFFFKHRDNIKNELPHFLKNLLSFLFVKFIETPTVNAIKDSIFQACIDIYNNGYASLSYPIVDFESRINRLSSSKIAKPIFLLNTYLFDKNQELLPQDFQIEHIFPQKWDTTYFTWTNENAEKYINMLGNKIAFEKKLNIQASNGFFSKKKDYYNTSKILEVKSLRKLTDWTSKDIEKRNNEIIIRLKSFFESNLLSKNVIKDKILEYTGGNGNTSAIIDKITTGDKVVYCLSIDGVKEIFDSVDDAIKKIDKGLLLYGVQQYLSDDEEIINVINSLLND